MKKLLRLFWGLLGSTDRERHSTLYVLHLGMFTTLMLQMSVWACVQGVLVVVILYFDMMKKMRLAVHTAPLLYPKRTNADEAAGVDTPQ